MIYTDMYYWKKFHIFPMFITVLVVLKKTEQEDTEEKLADASVTMTSLING